MKEWQIYSIFSFFFIALLSKKFAIFNATFSLISRSYKSQLNVNTIILSRNFFTLLPSKHFSRTFIGKFSKTFCLQTICNSCCKLGAKLARICIYKMGNDFLRNVYGITAAFVYLAIYPHECKQHFSTAVFHKGRTMREKICTSRSEKHVFLIVRWRAPWWIIEFDKFLFFRQRGIVVRWK